MSDKDVEEVVVRVPKAIAARIRADSPGQDFGKLIAGMVVGFEKLREWMNVHRDSIEALRGGDDFFGLMTRLLEKERREKSN